LLQVTRPQVLDYLVELGQDYRTDESNLDLRLTRNRIRHELLPLLARDYNPRILDVLVRLRVQASDAQWALAGAARQLLRRAERQSAGSLVILDSATVARAQPWILCRTWRLLWKRSGWPMGEMGFRQWIRLADLCRGRYSALDLPGGIRVRCKGRVI